MHFYSWRSSRLGAQPARPQLIAQQNLIQRVAVGKTVLLECSVDYANFYAWSVRLASDPSRTVQGSMLIDRRVSGRDQRTLQIKGAELDDAGNYTCVATSRSGKSILTTVELNVYDPHNERAPTPFTPTTYASTTTSTQLLRLLNSLPLQLYRPLQLVPIRLRLRFHPPAQTASHHTIHYRPSLVQHITVKFYEFVCKYYIYFVI